MQPKTHAILAETVTSLQSVAGLIRQDTNDVIATGNHVDVIRHYNDVRTATEQIKEARKALDAIEESLSRETVPDFMRSAQVKTITIEGVGRVTISNRFGCSILDKEQAFDWLRSNGHGGIIQETVNSSTLAAFAKSLIEEQNRGLPDEMFKTSTTTYTSITKAK